MEARLSRKCCLIILLCIVGCVQKVHAQHMEIIKFEANPTNLMARSQPRKDRNGEDCALIRFAVQDVGFKIEGNLGVVHTIRQTGMILVYVPEGTKKLNVRYSGLLPIMDYEIPVKIEKKCTYDATLVFTSDGLDAINRKPERNKGHNVYLGGGFNFLSIFGPTPTLGFIINHHNVELGFTYGIQKSDALYYYNIDATTLNNAVQYRPLRTQLRYGYGFDVTDFLTLMPQVGACANIFNGTVVPNISVASPEYMRRGWSISGITAVRLLFSPTNWLKLHLTPEYDFAIKKNVECDIISNNDSKFSSWTKGFNLNAGIMVFF